MNEEYICDKCNGNGVEYINVDLPKEYSPQLICSKCLGVGKLDWLENILGKIKIDKITVSSKVNNHNDKLEKNSLSWCLERIDEGGELILEPGNYELIENLKIPKDLNLNVVINNSNFNLNDKTLEINGNYIEMNFNKIHSSGQNGRFQVNTINGGKFVNNTVYATELNFNN